MANKQDRPFGHWLLSSPSAMERVLEYANCRGGMHQILSLHGVSGRTGSGVESHDWTEDSVVE